MSGGRERQIDSREIDRSLAKALGYRVEEARRPEVGALWWVLTKPDGSYGRGCSDHSGWATEEAAWATLPSLSTTWEGLGLVVEAMGHKGFSFDLHVWEDGHAQAMFEEASGAAQRAGSAYGTSPHAATGPAALRALGVEADYE